MNFCRIVRPNHASSQAHHHRVVDTAAAVRALASEVAADTAEEEDTEAAWAAEWEEAWEVADVSSSSPTFVSTSKMSCCVSLTRNSSFHSRLVGKT